MYTKLKVNLAIQIGVKIKLYLLMKIYLSHLHFYNIHVFVSIAVCGHPDEGGGEAARIKFFECQKLYMQHAQY